MLTKGCVWIEEFKGEELFFFCKLTKLENISKNKSSAVEMLYQQQQQQPSLIPLSRVDYMDQHSP